MNCCSVQIGQKPRRSWWRDATGGAASGALLVLMPKCPFCIAAYLALWTGAGVAMPVATHLRSVLEIVFVAWVLLLLGRWMVIRVRA